MSDSMKRGFARLRNQEHAGPQWRVLDLTPYLVAQQPEDDNPIPPIGEVVLPVSLEVDVVPIVVRDRQIAPERRAFGFGGRFDLIDKIEDGGPARDCLDDEPEDDDGDPADGGVQSVLDALEDDDEITEEMVSEMSRLATDAVAGPTLVAKLGGVEVDEVLVAESEGATTITGSWTAVVETTEGRFGIGRSLNEAISAFASRARYVAIPVNPGPLIHAAITLDMDIPLGEPEVPNTNL